MSLASGPIRILLVDDHAVVRAGYRMLLKDVPELEVVAEADCGEVACQVYSRVSPDVVVMDISLPGMGGIEAIRRIRGRDDNAKILVFSMYEDLVFISQALEAGARGYVSKSSAPEILAEAVLEIAGGKIHLDNDVARQLAMQKARGSDTLFGGLSTREFEIFCLLAEGVAANEIALRLSLSYKTIANYSTQIKNKLRVTTVVELARLAIRHGLIKA